MIYDIFSCVRICSPRGSTAELDGSVLRDFLLLRVSEGLSCSHVGVKRVCPVVGEVNAGILKVILLLRLIGYTLQGGKHFQLHIFTFSVEFTEECSQDRKGQSNSSCGNDGKISLLHQLDAV